MQGREDYSISESLLLEPSVTVVTRVRRWARRDSGPAADGVISSVTCESQRSKRTNLIITLQAPVAVSGKEASVKTIERKEGL